MSKKKRTRVVYLPSDIKFLHKQLLYLLNEYQSDFEKPARAKPDKQKEVPNQDEHNL